jgi:RNA polymerase sigma-70 factor (ECF subfamily)
VTAENVAQPNNDLNHPGVALEHRELVSTWFHRIDQLAENQRTAIVLVRIEEFSPAEAAAIMNLSVKAVDSLLQRAKKNLIKIELKSEGK